MAKQTLHLLALLSAAVATAMAAAPPSTNATVFELLPQYGLPPGLLPDTVKSFSLSNDGRFVVDLESTCYVLFDYLVYYEEKITGKIQLGGISDLKGIQVKRLLMWFDVDAIKVDLPPSGSIYFYVGWITKELDAKQFQTVHTCESSLACNKFVKSAKNALKLPKPVREISMLLTE